MDYVTQRLLAYRRRPSRTVGVGHVNVGGKNPIRVQSMCTSDTKNTEAVVSEIRGLVEAGCEIVRVTVPTQADCDNLPDIRAKMKKEGLKVPLVADIHFTPSIALKAVEYVEKVRINPGNFVDKKLFKVVDYSDLQYQEELERLREKFLPLVLKCREYGVALRIGTNHGSLSDRIMNRYGDTPEGMVESALEFVRICEAESFKNIIFSMKASNVQIMTSAYRLLAQRLGQLGLDYPFHLGVTEAGAGSEGRVKSAAGIGALLEDGLGDTIRVSLTEDSVYEVPVAYQIVQNYNLRHAYNQLLTSGRIEKYYEPRQQENDSPTSRRRPTPQLDIGPHPHGFTEPVRVWVATSHADAIANYSRSSDALDQPLEGIEISSPLDQNSIEDVLAAAKPLTALAICIPSPRELSRMAFYADKLVALVTPENAALWHAVDPSLLKNKVWEWRLCISDITQLTEEWVSHLESLSKIWPVAGLVYSVESADTVYANRQLAFILDRIHSEAHHHLVYRRQKNEIPLLASSTALGALLMDGIGESLTLDLVTQYDTSGSVLSLPEAVSLAYNILQGVRLRVSKTEYISCPSCGRTLFDLQTTTDKVRRSTSHLKGVKIAVMGCIVNGPGEMADADFGYVGTGPKKISLYVGKECVERNISEEKAVEELVLLIKKHGRWVDPVVERQDE